MVIMRPHLSPSQTYTVFSVLAALVLVTLYDYSFETDLPRRELRGRREHRGHRNRRHALGSEGSKVKVSYVTSFWAQSKDSTASPHRKEMEAALLANVHNPHFDQAVVFLDGVSAEANCDHFLKGMKELNGQLGEAEASVDPLAKLTCVDMPGGQPTYYQMFQNTLHDSVTGDVVVLANADQAFDETIQHARNLDPEVLLVLGTHGFDNKIPPQTKRFYDTLVQRVSYRKDAFREIHSDPHGDRCANIPWSWDAWIFHKIKLVGQLKESDFKRPNAINTMVPFYMNENGAELAALWGVEQSDSFQWHYNACEMIHSWHFHLTPKTHKDHKTPWSMESGQPGGAVPFPWGGKSVDVVVGGAQHPHPPKVHEVEKFLLPGKSAVG